jgi:Zn-dependent protease
MDPINEQDTSEHAPEPHIPLIPLPKYQKVEAPSNVWLRSFMSLALYLILGYYIFHSFEMLILITAIIMFHELGHFLAMKAFRYKDLGIFFIPLLGAYVSGTKREVSQKESAIILLAGPLPGMILGVVLYLLWENNMELSFAGISFYTISLSLIILNLINLLPIFPLDGGQLLNRIFLDEEGWISKSFVILSVGFLCWVAIFGIGMPWGIPLLLFPALMISRFFGDSKLDIVEKKIEEEGISLDTAYEDLSDEDYWRMRNILITHHAGFKDVALSPPYEYDEKEEKIMLTVRNLLHRNLIQDISLAGKLLILVICVSAFATPWLLDMDMSFFRRFGF